MKQYCLDMTASEYKEVFVLLAGATPQVITETIYALAIQEPPVRPDEIHIVTTAKGKAMVEETLIGRGILTKLFEEYEIPEKSLHNYSIIVPQDGAGAFLDDIQDEEENARVGDLILNVLREKAKDPAVRLHCSLAGGRKTMSFYLGAALQLFGRPWDRLYHVLVSPEFESNREFFYKPVKDTVIQCRLPDGTTKRLNTRDAVVKLAELPFIRLGGKIPLKEISFNRLVAEGQKEIDTATLQPPITVRLFERTIQVGDTYVEMVPVQIIFYTAFLRQKTDYCKYPERAYCQECTDCFITFGELDSESAIKRLAHDYTAIYGNAIKGEELYSKWEKGLGESKLRPNIAKINKEIRENLEDETLHPYCRITSLRKWGSTRYGVRAEKGKIKVQ